MSTESNLSQYFQNTLAAQACSFALSEINGRIQLFPYGEFKAVDGRPSKGCWYVNQTNGTLLAQQINRLSVELMIDYEHQTLFAEKNGQGNPAAGWIKQVEYIEGEGLFADVHWTPKAREQIKNGEYRYISPYFIPAGDGGVSVLINAALTNRPALHQLAAAQATSFQFQTQPPLNTEEQHAMNVKPLLLSLLGLADTATDAEISAKCTALSQATQKAGVAVSEVYAQLAESQQYAQALSAQVAAQASEPPDPTKYVALSEFQSLQQQFLSLQASVNQEKTHSLIATALSDGRLLPSQKAWAENLGKTNPQALSDFLTTTVPIQALNGTQSNGVDPNKAQANAVALSAAERAAAHMLGMTEQEYRNKTTEQEKK